MGPEATGFHYEAGGPTGCYEVLDHWLGDFRKGGPGESWSSAPAGVGGEGELADYQEAALDVENGPVETTGFVRENPEVQGLFLQVVGVFAGVVLLDAEEKAKAGVDASQGFSVDGDGCAGDSLEESLQKGVSCRK